MHRIIPVHLEMMYILIMLRAESSKYFKVSIKLILELGSTQVIRRKL